ncbi:aldolase/citrate lyase family protein [Dermatophilus congolensis]|uniref:aldolase/citrate lyase family protein n=1 Tax=Dermatophilus congolensis TaxID=1863 RepID=UPI001AAFBBEB|nr:HpcH/HpaI aldolase/citrate lyase family protein [Dermatophilus congolensis]MBO3132056.1 HpcH/HpaI aldolase/citrate lyase family protein [Dermatophilus congolensis]MBO3133788.1 HpcH/HpaI aldolase/citrate lyase family protein [Dermatophilus congolensis]MBO3136019.1 HpcH/HpaI aldolase/citrate lyase family protein [Dermatophilus congolensis]MBO3138261.1 HpcH/HpaI aldolase/citrate lyase family protein [Dermatophilus congolensis]
MSIRLKPTLRDCLAQAERPLAGVWACAGSPVVTEIIAGAGMDWVLIDMEHSPNGLASVLTQLQVVSGYPVTPMVRVPSDDPVVIKQVLDVGAESLLVPMVSTPEQAEAVVRACQYPPQGIRGVGSRLARSARWGRVGGYLGQPNAHVAVFVQVETVEGVRNAEQIARVEGVDGVFVGPSDLAASMGLIGQLDAPELEAAVQDTFRAVTAAGKPVGVNAFDPQIARRYAAAGASFVLVAADVTILARGSEKLARAWVPETDA